MTESIYTDDGTTVTRRYRDTPRWHWVADTPTTGHFVAADTSTGYFPLVEVERPADTDTTTHDLSIVRDTDTFTQRWTARPWTDDELAARLQAEAPDPIDVLTEQTVAAANIDPRPWEADRRYLPGAIVRNGVDGDRYQNDLGVVNVWPLTERHARWTNLDAVEPTVPEPWEQRGSTDPYMIGDPVLWPDADGDVWESTIDNNTWSPATYPAGWQQI